MTLRIVKASDPLTVERVNLCIYGAPGVGKTSLGFTADDPLLLDADRGAHRAKNRRDTVQIATWDDVVKIAADDLKPYRTVIVDTAGRLLDIMTIDIINNNQKLGRGGALTLQGFGVLKAYFISWLKMINSHGKDTVLLAHMDEQRSGDDVIERLDVQGGSKAEIYKSVDAMGRIVLTATGRAIDFSPRPNSFGKNPCNWEVLPFPDPATEPNFLGKLIRDMKTNLNQRNQEEKKAQEDISDWEVAFRDFDRADDFNAVMTDLKTAPMAVKMMAMRRAKELGLIFNRVSGFYEEVPHAS